MAISPMTGTERVRRWRPPNRKTAMTTTQPTAAVRVDVTRRESASRRGRPHPASAESAPRTRRPTNRVSETYPGCCSRCTLASPDRPARQTAPMRDLRGAQQVPGPSPQERSRSPEVSGNQGQERLQQRELPAAPGVRPRFARRRCRPGWSATRGGTTAARGRRAGGVAPAARGDVRPRRGPRRPSHRAGWRAARDPDPRRSRSWASSKPSSRSKVAERISMQALGTASTSAGASC